MPTSPGFHPDFEVTQYPTAIRVVIGRIAANFYVTRSFRPIRIGNSEYWAILVRPTDEFSVYINTDRKILVLFSQYKTFEIRTLEAYEEFYNLLKSKRIDRSLRFLVSGDEKISPLSNIILISIPSTPSSSLRLLGSLVSEREIHS